MSDFVSWAKRRHTAHGTSWPLSDWKYGSPEELVKYSVRLMPPPVFEVWLYCPGVYCGFCGRHT